MGPRESVVSEFHCRRHLQWKGGGIATSSDSLIVSCSILYYRQLTVCTGCRLSDEYLGEHFSRFCHLSPAGLTVTVESAHNVTYVEERIRNFIHNVAPLYLKKLSKEMFEDHKDALVHSKLQKPTGPVSFGSRFVPLSRISVFRLSIPFRSRSFVRSSRSVRPRSIEICCFTAAR